MTDRNDAGKRTFTRRTLLDWFGRTSALSLAGLASGCVSEDTTAFTLNRSPDAGWRLPLDSGTRNEDSRPGSPRDIGSSAGQDIGERRTENGIIFQATTDEDTTVIPWGENTVDRQDEQLLLDYWTLTIDGLVENPVTLTFAEMLALERQDQVTDFHCVEGWSVWDVPWNGVHFSTLFELVKPLSNASHVTFHCFTAPNNVTYDESLPIDVCLEPKTLMAYGADNLALPLRHGFPLRCIIPRLHGYKGAKTVHRIEVADAPIDGFWVRRGYPYDAPVEPERLREGKY